MSLVYVIEDDPTMADVIALAARSTVLFDMEGKEMSKSSMTPSSHSPK